MKNDLAVIDTNVLVSSLIGQAGYSRKIFDDLIVPVNRSPKEFYEFQAMI